MTSDQQFILAIIASIVAAIGSVAAAINTARTTAKVAVTDQKVERLSISVDGRLTKLLDTTTQLSHARGILDARAAEDTRTAKIAANLAAAAPPSTLAAAIEVAEAAVDPSTLEITDPTIRRRDAP